MQEVIRRVCKMEMYFDMLKKAIDTDADSFMNDDTSQCLHILAEYYESGQWLKDYELDEKGAFPQDMKRGVLSQDALYNLLEDADEILNEIKKRG